MLEGTVYSVLQGRPCSSNRVIVASDLTEKQYLEMSNEEHWQLQVLISLLEVQPMPPSAKDQDGT